MGTRILVRWVVEQWYHGNHSEPEGESVVTDVVVPRKWSDAVVAAAERICREAAEATV